MATTLKIKNWEGIKGFFKDAENNEMVSNLNFTKSENIETISFITREKRIQIMNITPKNKKILFWGKSKMTGVFFDFIESSEDGCSFNLFKKKFGVFNILIGFLKFKKG